MPIGHARLMQADHPGAALDAGPWRAVFPWRSALEVTDMEQGDLNLAEGMGHALGRGACRLNLTDVGGRCFVWEISAALPPVDVPVGLTVLRDYTMPRLLGEADPGTATLRFERVDLFPGVVTPRHTHRGSGLRVLISGRLQAEVDGHCFRLEPGDSWLEKGPGEAVVGRAAQDPATAFVRLLVLPAECLNQDSFVVLDARDAQRPKPAAYDRFHEERLAL